MQKTKLTRSSTESSNFFKSKKLTSSLSIAVLLLSTAVVNSVSAAQAAPMPYSPLQATSVTAASVLKTLSVKGRAPKTGYARQLFGDSWGDIGDCDVRNYILKRDLTSKVWRKGETCVLERGKLKDPYTGKVISFVRGVATSSKVQIDHVVSISDAWQKGAQRWTQTKRETFYNDPLNLLAVDGPTNGSKSDSDAASWLPPNKSYRCAFVARQIAVKAKYAVWVTAAEKTAMSTVLGKCPNFKLPKG
jgi:hypothetical protein